MMFLQVSGVVWADSPRLCALILGTPVALIVSIGAREAEVCAGNFFLSTACNYLTTEIVLLLYNININLASFCKFRLFIYYIYTGDCGFLNISTFGLLSEKPLQHIIFSSKATFLLLK
jgi:hypothetical protein